MADPLKAGYFVLILEAGANLEDEIEKGLQFFHIVTEEPLISESADLALDDAFASVATGSDSGWKDHDKIEPREEPPELYQVRCGFEDGCAYYVKLPSGTERFGVYEKRSIGKMNNVISPKMAKNEDYEFWLINGIFPSFKADNDTGYSITPNVFFEGFKYNIKKVADKVTVDRLKSGSLPYRVIVLGGILG